MAAWPKCLACRPQSAFAGSCVMGKRSKGCGSTALPSERARAMIEKARRWESMRRAAGAIVWFLSLVWLEE
jgi:hypothetical protein